MTTLFIYYFWTCWQNSCFRKCTHPRTKSFPTKTLGKEYSRTYRHIPWFYPPNTMPSIIDSHAFAHAEKNIPNFSHTLTKRTRKLYTRSRGPIFLWLLLKQISSKQKSSINDTWKWTHNGIYYFVRHMSFKILMQIIDLIVSVYVFYL